MRKTFFFGVMAAVSMAIKNLESPQNFNLAQIGEEFDDLALA